MSKILKPLTVEETRLKEEMKRNCLKDGQYKDPKAKVKFDMLCHLEDFEIQYYNLLEENSKIIKMNLNKHKYASEIEGKYILECEKNRKAIEYIKELYDETDDITCWEIGKNVREDLLKILEGENE